MDPVRAAALYILLRRRRLRQKRRRNRNLWVHPINLKRDEIGLFRTLFEDLHRDKNKFFNYFRMSISSFEQLHEKVKNHLQLQNTKMRNCIQPEEMLAIALR